jgi:hypothetical protein
MPSLPERTPPANPDLDPAIEAELVHLVFDGEPCGRCFDDEPVDDDDDLVLIDEPPPPPVLTKCALCRGPLTVWHGEVVCCNCTTWTLPDTGEWLAEDDCGRGGV